jgi:hypothetical protein
VSVGEVKGMGGDMPLTIKLRDIVAAMDFPMDDFSS